MWSEVKSRSRECPLPTTFLHCRPTDALLQFANPRSLLCFIREATPGVPANPAWPSSRSFASGPFMEAYVECHAFNSVVLSSRAEKTLDLCRTEIVKQNRLTALCPVQHTVSEQVPLSATSKRLAYSTQVVLRSHKIASSTPRVAASCYLASE